MMKILKTNACIDIPIVVYNHSIFLVFGNREYLKESLSWRLTPKDLEKFSKVKDIEKGVIYQSTSISVVFVPYYRRTSKCGQFIDSQVAKIAVYLITLYQRGPKAINSLLSFIEGRVEAAIKESTAKEILTDSNPDIKEFIKNL